MTWRALLLIVAIVALAIPTWIAPGWIGSHLVLRTAEPDAKTIAFSFDDVPRGPGAFYTPEERTRLLIAALRDAGVEQAVFFVNPGGSGHRRAGLLACRLMWMRGMLLAITVFRIVIW